MKLKLKGGKSLVISLIVISIIVVALALFVVAQNGNLTGNVTAEIGEEEEGGEIEGELEESVGEVEEESGERKKRISVSNITGEFIAEFLESSGISEEDINEIDEVNLNDLPREVNIKNIAKANVGIYEINYTDPVEQEPEAVFVVTFASPSFKPSENPIVGSVSRTYLDFGYDGTANESIYLDAATGVKVEEGEGYVMMRSGSLTGLSTHLEILSGSGSLNIKIYKNGVDTGFENIINVPKEGNRIDYDTQAPYIDEFEAGDIISVYVEDQGDISYRDVVVLVEIET